MLEFTISNSSNMLATTNGLHETTSPKKDSQSMAPSTRELAPFCLFWDSNYVIFVDSLGSMWFRLFSTFMISNMLLATTNGLHEAASPKKDSQSMAPSTLELAPICLFWDSNYASLVDLLGSFWSRLLSASAFLASSTSASRGLQLTAKDYSDETISSKKDSQSTAPLTRELAPVCLFWESSLVGFELFRFGLILVWTILVAYVFITIGICTSIDWWALV